MKIKMMML